MERLKLPSILLVIIFFVCALTPSFAQDVQIETTNLAILDKKLEISYEFVSSKKKHRFDVWLEITTVSGKKINARALAGDIGDNLPGGKDKKIIWDYNADGIVLNEEINVKVKAIVSTVVGAVNTGKVILQSVAFPGWGLSTIDPDKPYWLLGVAGYASLGTSLYLRSSYKSNYDSYLNATDSDESKDFYDKSQSQKSLSGIFAYSAIGIWSFGIIWTAIKASKKNNSLTVRNDNQKFYFFSSYDPKFKANSFTIRYKF
ncbi:MAG: hypothetical protein DRI95_06565 [Bacteroidetes bacterium]|nr:MAG: hypothetical protein DRI95_06565 [Bacteroidota bacterium]